MEAETVLPLWKATLKMWRILVSFVLLPVATIPLLQLGGKEGKCAYVIIIMAASWLTEALPVALTALMPIALFPVLGIMTTEEVCNAYVKEMVMVTIGSLLVAMAIEQCNLHERIALRVLLAVGTSPKWLLLGFMLPTMFLSMWISTAPTTAMMIPIVLAVVREMNRSEARCTTKPESNGERGTALEKRQSINSQADSCKSDYVAETAEQEKLKKALLIAVAYSSTCGGTGTIIGAGPNMVFAGVLAQKYPESREVTFATWMMYNVPGMLLCTLSAWIVLLLVFGLCRVQDENVRISVRTLIQRKYDALGALSFREGAVIFLFATLLVLWFFRDPKFIDGWSTLFELDAVKDATPVIGIALLFFAIPYDLRNGSRFKPLLDWRQAQLRIPWGVILLLGGGYAMAEGSLKSGLSRWIGVRLSGLGSLPTVAIVVVLCLMTTFLTEIASNAATASILLPIVGDLAQAIRVNPIYLMMPVVISCSFAFTLPISTPPNALVFESTNMRATDMVLPGLIMNVVCCALELMLISVLGVPMFGLDAFPSWAEAANATDSQPSTNASSYL